MTPSRLPFVGLPLAALALGCGSSGGSLDVGTDEGGLSSVFPGTDASGQGAFDAYIEQNDVTVKFITLNCSGDCATVEAVGTGGYPPYTFRWDDGSTSAMRKICRSPSTNYTVKVTDTGTSGELARAPETVQVPLTAKGLACPDGGLLACSDGGGAGSGVLSGRYAGTVYCPPDGGVINVPTTDGGQNSGTVTLDLSVNGTAVGGSLYFTWSVGGAIAWQAELEGALDCSKGALQATWENARWGLPTTGADGGMTILLGGTGTGSITATPVSGSSGTISGNFDFAPSSGGSCDGTYAATLEP
jgi:hypothetical protein